ncbi:uncharacterized protein TNCV_1491291 [Trichonephila clavipes]|nr:uncharacterized protein TNCV_1491291 [Trichonephila clavipes]
MCRCFDQGVNLMRNPSVQFPIPVPASPVSVKLYTYDRKTSWEVYKIQFCIISEANGWTEKIKACQLVASLRGKSAEVLQTLPDTKRLNLNTLYNDLDLRFGQKYSKDYARLQMKRRLQKTGESLQEYAFEIQRLTSLAFSEFSANVRERISFEYFVNGLKDEEIQRAVRMEDVQDIKSALLYALRLEAVNQVSCIDLHSIRGARVTADVPCESPWLKEIEKLIKKIPDLMAQWHARSNYFRVNEEYPHRAKVIELKKVCSHRKGSEDGNINAPSSKPSPENIKYSWRVEKKFGVIDPEVHQGTTPPPSESNPELWFQQYGATYHTARATIDLLKDTFGDRLISRFEPVNWPPRSCDLTPLDYFLWGYVKSLVYAYKPQMLAHLEDNIRRVIADIRPQMLEKVIENWTSRLDYI